MNTSPRRLRRNTITLVCAFAISAVHTLHAQALPDPRAVLEKYVRVTNATTLAARPGQRTRGTFEMSAQGVTGQVEGYRDSGGRFMQVITIPGIGELKEGMDTNFRWSMNPIEGPKLIEGRDFLEAREREVPRAVVRDPALVVSVVAVKRDSVAGSPCVLLALSWKSGRTTRECYDESTGYLVASETAGPTAAGSPLVSTTFSEFRTFDGVTVPTKTVQRAGTAEIVMRLTELVFETADSAKFVPPSEVRALVKK